MKNFTYGSYNVFRQTRLIQSSVGKFEFIRVMKYRFIPNEAFHWTRISQVKENLAFDAYTTRGKVITAELRSIRQEADLR